MSAVVADNMPRRITALKYITPDIAERERRQLIAVMGPHDMCLGCDCDLDPIPRDDVGLYVLKMWGYLHWHLLCPRCADRRPRWFGGGRVFKPASGGV